MKTILLVISIISVSFGQLLNAKVMDSLLLTMSLESESESIKNLDDFKSINIDGGKGFQCKDDACRDTLQKFSLPSGVLFSDKKALTYIYYEKIITDANRRFVIAKDLYDQQSGIVNKTINEYDNRIVKLEKEAKRSWLEKNNIYIGFIIGVATAIAIESITVKAIQ